MTSPVWVAAILVIRRFIRKVRTGFASSPSAISNTASCGASASSRSGCCRSGCCRTRFWTVYSSLPSALTATDWIDFTLMSRFDCRAAKTTSHVLMSMPYTSSHMLLSTNAVRPSGASAIAPEPNAPGTRQLRSSVLVRMSTTCSRPGRVTVNRYSSAPCAAAIQPAASSATHSGAARRGVLIPLY